jgi:hypothetical protein
MVLAFRFYYQFPNLSGIAFFERKIEIKFKASDLKEDLRDEFDAYYPEHHVNPVKKQWKIHLKTNPG